MPYTDKQRQASDALMTRGEPVSVSLVAHDGRRAPGTLRLERLSPEEQGRRARRFLFTFLAIAPLSVVFPPHLLWPLAMVTVGVVGYYARRGRPEVILGGQGSCPACGAFQLLDGGNPEWPMAHFCSECRRRALVEKAPGPEPAPPPATGGSGSPS